MSEALLGVSRVDGPVGSGPDGASLSLDHLPESNTTRWVTSRKVAVIAAIRGGLLTIDDAAKRYSLTLDELTEWQSHFDRHGTRGLRTTFVQQYRHMRRA